MTHERNVLSSSSLVGDSVRNRNDENLGKIEELMIDVADGNIAYAVLSFGGVLGMGDKLFAVPWQALTVDQNRQEFVLDVDKQQLKDAPGFEKDDWPDFADATFRSNVSTYYARPIA